MELSIPKPSKVCTVWKGQHMRPYQTFQGLHGLKRSTYAALSNLPRFNGSKYPFVPIKRGCSNAVLTKQRESNTAYYDRVILVIIASRLINANASSSFWQRIRSSDTPPPFTNFGCPRYLAVKPPTKQCLLNKMLESSAGSFEASSITRSRICPPFSGWHVQNNSPTEVASHPASRTSHRTVVGFDIEWVCTTESDIMGSKVLIIYSFALGARKQDVMEFFKCLAASKAQCLISSISRNWTLPVVTPSFLSWTN